MIESSRTELFACFTYNFKATGQTSVMKAWSDLICDLIKSSKTATKQKKISPF